MSRANRAAAESVEKELDRIEVILEERGADIDSIPCHVRERIHDRIKTDRIGIELSRTLYHLDTAEIGTAKLGRDSDRGEPADRVRHRTFAALEELREGHLLFVLLELSEFVEETSSTEPELIELGREIDAILEEHTEESAHRRGSA